jgi:hypothetical protein
MWFYKRGDAVKLANIIHLNLWVKRMTGRWQQKIRYTNRGFADTKTAILVVNQF